MVGVCGESWSGTPGLLSSNGETEALDSGPSSALPRPGAQRLTHSLDKYSTKGRLCVPPAPLSPGRRRWGSSVRPPRASPDVELRPRMWNSIPGCGNLQLNCTRLGSLGGPVVKTSPSDAGRVGLIPPGGAGAAHALWPKKPRCRTEPIL